MAETKLTKDIKESLRTYTSILKSSNRTVRWAEEVTVKAGIVDVMRFEDDFVSSKFVKQCELDVYRCIKTVKDDACKKVNYDCENCGHYTELVCRKYGITATCYEVKITKADFKSKNGHNFVGNYNYYVIPVELYSDIKDLVSESVGIITYNGNMLRKRKDAVYQEIPVEDLNLYLYNALKKWISGFEDTKRLISTNWHLENKNEYLRQELKALREGRINHEQSS